MASATTPDRAASFWAHVTKGDPDQCWEWTGLLFPSGYPKFRLTSRKSRGAHREAYELLVGPIPDGLEIDHLCFNIICVNPAHLEAVTRQENIRRRRHELTRRPLGDSSDPRHGTPNAYGHYGCRCQRCRRANADAHLDYMRRRRERAA